MVVLWFMLQDQDLFMKAFSMMKVIAFKTRLLDGVSLDSNNLRTEKTDWD